MIKYNLQTQSDFLRNSVNDSKYSLNFIRFFTSKFWKMVPMEKENSKSLEDFRNKIRRWEPDGCDCKLYKDFRTVKTVKFRIHGENAAGCEIGTGSTMMATEQCQ